MREALREVAEELAASRVDLLRVEADIVRAPDQLVEQLRGGVDPTPLRVRVGEPERAGDEGAFGPGQAVVAVVTADERTRRELARMSTRVYGSRACVKTCSSSSNQASIECQSSRIASRSSSNGDCS